MNVKACTKCNVVEPLDYFHRDKTRSDGRASACAECVCEQKRDYQSRDDVKARRNELEEQRRKNTEAGKKHRCRTTTKYAIKSGKLIKDPCMHCGTTENVQAHHEDYTKPYDVWWLCANCHVALHVARRREAEEKATFKKAA